MGYRVWFLIVQLLPLGVSLQTFVAIQAGQTLNELNSLKDAVPLSTGIKVFMCGIVVMLPVLFKERVMKQIS